MTPSITGDISVKRTSIALLLLATKINKKNKLIIPPYLKNT